MSTVTVDHLHARYHTSVVLARRLGEQVHPLIGPSVAAALLDVTAVPDADHVCVPTLELDVELDVGGAPGANGRAWARELVTQLLARLDDADVVVYRRHADALADAVVGLATGDTTRATAWQQADVVPPGAALACVDEAVPALVRDAVLLPTVLRGVLAAGAVPLFDARSWQALGAAWVLATDRTATGRLVAPTQVPDGVVRLVGSVPDEAVTGDGGEAVITLLTTLLPVGTPAGEDVTPAAALVQTLRDAASPGHDRSPATDLAPATESARDRGPTATDSPTVPPRAAPQDPTEPTGARPTTGVVSDWAGLLLLLGPVATLGIADAVATPGGPLTGVPVPDALAAVAATLARVPPDDPVLALLRGVDPTEPASGVAPRRPLDALPDDRRVAATAAVDAAAARIEQAVCDALGTAPGSDLSHVWRRRGEIVWSPTWIEVTFPIELVDVAVRRAGLDLDPGWVWWLGAVVRFRYA